MADSSDVVDRADSLMRRRRSFVAAPPASLPAQIDETPQDVEEDDIDAGCGQLRKRTPQQAEVD